LNFSALDPCFNVFRCSLAASDGELEDRDEEWDVEGRAEDTDFEAVLIDCNVDGALATRQVSEASLTALPCSWRSKP